MAWLKNILHLIFVYAILMVSCAPGFAQNSEKAKQLYEKATKHAEKGKLENVVDLYTEAISAEIDMGVNADNVFIAEILFKRGRVYIHKDYYGVASQNFFLSAIYYQKGGDTSNAQAAIQQAAYFEDSAAKYQSRYMFDKFNVNRGYIRLPIASISRSFGDTTWFTMNVGTRDSIRPNQKGWFVTIYDADNPERDVISYGKTTVISVDYGHSLWYVVRSDEGKESGFTPQVGDLNYVEVGRNPDVLNGLIDELVKYNIMLCDGYKNPLYSYKNGQMISRQESEDAIIGIMRDIIIGTAKELYDPESDFFTAPIDSGAFSGLNLWEQMLQTKPSDVKAFLRFVTNYPGKYMGRKFRRDVRHLVNQFYTFSRIRQRTV